MKSRHDKAATFARDSGPKIKPDAETRGCNWPNEL